MTLTVLTIASSPMEKRSITRKLTDKVLNSLKTAYPDSQFVCRDLAASPLLRGAGASEEAFKQADQQVAKAVSRAKGAGARAASRAL
jgi:FMN-dependent NADH-azoreductase